MKKLTQVPAYSYTCDGCGREARLKMTEDQARLAMVLAGWIVISSGELTESHYCRDCAKQRWGDNLEGKTNDRR